MPKTEEREWEKEFELMEINHGWIPEHKEIIKDFIRRVEDQAYQSAKDKVASNLEGKWEVIQGSDWTKDYISGFNECRSQLLTNLNNI